MSPHFVFISKCCVNWKTWERRGRGQKSWILRPGFEVMLFHNFSLMAVVEIRHTKCCCPMFSFGLVMDEGEERLMKAIRNKCPLMGHLGSMWLSPLGGRRRIHPSTEKIEEKENCARFRVGQVCTWPFLARGDRLTIMGNTFQATGLKIISPD